MESGYSLPVALSSGLRSTIPDFSRCLPLPAYAQPEPRCHCTNKQDEITEAATVGNLARVQELFADIHQSECKDHWKGRKKCRSALQYAVRNQHVTTVEYLLGQGIVPNGGNARTAFDKRNMTILGMLQQHGWDINEEISYDQPGLLWYVRPT